MVNGSQIVVFSFGVFCYTLEFFRVIFLSWSTCLCRATTGLLTKNGFVVTLQTRALAQAI